MVILGCQNRHFADFDNELPAWDNHQFHKNLKNPKNPCRFIRSIRDNLPDPPVASISRETYETPRFLASRCLGGNREAKTIGPK